MRSDSSPSSKTSPSRPMRRPSPQAFYASSSSSAAKRRSARQSFQGPSCRRSIPASSRYASGRATLRASSRERARSKSSSMRASSCSVTSSMRTTRRTASSRAPKTSSPPTLFRPSSCAWAAIISTPSRPQNRSAPSENGATRRRSTCSGRTRPFRSNTSRAF